MKKIIVLAIIIPVSNYAFSRDNVKLHGHVLHQLADSIKISYTLPSAKYQPVEYKAKLNNGDFAVAFEVPDGYTDLTIINGNEGTEIYVQPGTDLHLTVDAANFDSTIHYEGTGKEMANFTAKCVLEKHSIRETDLKAQSVANKQPDEYRAALKGLIEKESAYIQQNSNGLPQSFVAYLKKAQQYEVWYTMHMYPWKMEVYKLKTNNVKVIPNENYEIIFDIPEDFNDQYINMQSYRSYLNNFIGMRVKAENARNNITTGAGPWSDSVYARSYRILPPLTAEFVIGNRIYNSLQSKPVAEIEKRYVEYKARFPQSKNLAILEEAIANKRLIGPGKPEIDFDITTPEGQHMKLSDLKGKVVYIDFWSRSCVPCIAEMPDAKKVRAHFKDEPVAFVYVSEDEDEGTWKKAIKDFGIDGINTRLDKGKLSDLVQKYEAGGIPSHYLVDKNGKFADVNAVESPGDPERLITQIEALLK